MDATQQALLSIWQDLPRVRDPARFEASTTQHAPALAADVVHLAAVV